MDQLTTAEHGGDMDIAIIGMAGRFPGAGTIAEFWRNLCDGVESIAFFSDQELLDAGVDPAILAEPAYVKARGVLADIDQFDAAFFGFNPRDAEVMDPQHRLFLECAWEALEHAGYNSETYAGRIGVFAGTSMSTYLFNLYATPGLLQSLGGFQTRITNDKDFLPTRVSYKLNLKGPSITVQTGCSTSLVATALACQSLLHYQSDIVLAGGASIAVPQTAGYFYQPGGVDSPDGHCRAFDTRAQGSVGGSGVGVVVLKRLADALEDGDQIYAVIKGSAINNDGSLKVSYTAPSVDGQVAVIEEAIEMAGIAPETVGYIETHGAGTILGDPIEVTALTQVFRAHTDRSGFCGLGSVKTNIGHLDAAAGVAGLIKTTLALHHGLLPPSLNFEQPNPHINFAATPFYVNTELRPWEVDGHPRRAGVSSFGIGGTNAHVVLEQAPALEPSAPAHPWQLLLLSAKTDTALEAATDRLAAALRQSPAANLADVAYTLQVGRQAFGQRRALVCRDVDDAIAALEGRDPRRLLSNACADAERPVAFLFPGLGNHYVGMAAGLYQAAPVFRRYVDQCCELLRPYLDLDLRDVLYPGGPREDDQPAAPSGRLDLRRMLGRDDTPDPAAQRLNQTAITQPALFIIEYALAQQWIAWGIQPQALAGYSLGEYVAACLAGVFSLEDALRIVAERARMIQSLPAGAMLAVPLSEQAVRPLLGDELSLAAINGPELCVLSGPPGAIATLEHQLARRGLACRRLQTSHAFHSHMMEPIAAAFATLLKRVTLNAPAIPYLSNVTGTWITSAQATDPGYWVRHLCQAVRFGESIEQLWQAPGRIMLEVGPGQALSALAMQHPASALPDPVVLPSLRDAYERQADLAFLLGSLGKLWLAGVAPDWPALYDGERRQRVALPTYPFERRRYWIEPPKQSAAAAGPAIELGQVVDQGAEPALHPRPRVRNAYVAPRNATEQTIVDIWQRLLGIAQVGVHDSFFELGGHSLVATRLSLELQDAFQVEFPVRALLEQPTVAAFAEVVDLALKEGLAAGLAALGDADLGNEIVLDPSIVPAETQAPRVPHNILLTGATGFLGAFILHELLQHTQATIFCLVRAADEQEGLRRIQQNLATYALDPHLGDRVVPVVGELAEPLLGLDPAQFETLAATIDAIYHNGAFVNFVYPYQALKPTNVHGTQEVLRLAARTKVKPVHYVSTIAVFDTPSYARAEVVYEDEPLEQSNGFYTGYAQTKWVAEQLVRAAHARGIPTAIYRPGNVAGDSTTGRCNTADYLFRMAKGCIQLGLAPAVDTQVDITPVDYVSQALVQLSQQPESLGRVFHLVNPRPATWKAIVEWMVDFGYPIEQIPYEAWRAQLLGQAKSAEANALFPLLALFDEQPASQEAPVRDRMLQYDCRNTLAALEHTAVACPPLDDRLLTTYFTSFIESGFLEDPRLADALEPELSSAQRGS